MIRYILRRLILIIPVLIGVIIIVFTINYISPGDPAISLLGSNASPENIEALHKELGLDKPYIVQLINYIKEVLTKFDLGTSYQTRQPVTVMILERFPTTFTLGILSMIFSVVIGIPLGVVSATKQNTIIDYTATILSLIGAAVPAFWLGLMLMILFSLILGWLPPSGLDTPLHWIMPTVAVGIFPIAAITRTTRSSMLEVIRQDYIRTARSKGVTEYNIVVKHALKNAIIPVITVIGILLGLVLSGTLVLEIIFSIPGIGALIQTAVATNDYPVVQGSVLFCAIIICLVNLLVDILYAFIDPRIKSEYSKGKTRKIKKDFLQALENSSE